MLADQNPIISAANRLRLVARPQVWLLAKRGFRSKCWNSGSALDFEQAPNLNKRGFTLVELLVTIALFSILVSIAMGGFVSALHTEHQVAAMMGAESNVSIAIEEMMREIRTGYLFCHDNGATTPNSACDTAPDSCSIDASGVWTCSKLSYVNAQGNVVAYSLNNGVLERSDSSVNAGVMAPLTSSGVKITKLGFTLFGNTEGDHWTPRITIVIGVEPNDSTINWNTANLETSVSARQIDCDQGPPLSC